MFNLFENNQQRVSKQILKGFGVDIEKGKSKFPVGSQRMMAGVLMEKMEDGKWHPVKEKKEKEESKKGKKPTPQPRPK